MYDDKDCYSKHEHNAYEKRLVGRNREALNPAGLGFETVSF